LEYPDKWVLGCSLETGLAKAGRINAIGIDVGVVGQTVSPR